jgi:hypothetical protein
VKESSDETTVDSGGMLSAGDTCGNRLRLADTAWRFGGVSAAGVAVA